MAIEKLDTRVGEIYVIRPDEDENTVYLRAEVGSVANLAHPAHYLRAVLAGNRFGLETDGAVLSLGEGDDARVYLTARTTPAVADDPDALESALQHFAATLAWWRERLALEGVQKPETPAESEVR